MTILPELLEATAARYDRWYGTKPGDGGTSDQLRAGAQAMRRVEELRRALPDPSSVIAWLENGCSPGPAALELRIYQERLAAAEAKLAAYEETNDER